MSRPAVTITASYADGKTLDAFSRTLAQRQKYLNETAFQSIHAMAVETLKSLRGFTRVAKVSGIKVNVSPRTDLRFSYYTVQGGDRNAARMCIRGVDGGRYENGAIGKFVFYELHGVKQNAVQVYEFRDLEGDGQTYIIAAVSAAKARATAKGIVARRLLRFAGLAKRAMSALMLKTNNKGPSDAVSARVYAKANEVTTVRNAIATGKDGGKYALILDDDLRYATRALKGGRASVDLALRKAANKSVGLIQHKCKDLLFPGELKTPFPEITKKRSA